MTTTDAEAEALNRALGAEINKLRKEKGYSRAKLHERSGVAEIVIRRIESGQRAASVPVLVLLAHALGTDAGELVGRAEAAVDRTNSAPAVNIVQFIEARIVEQERDARKAQQAAESQGGELWVVTGADNPVGVDYDPKRELRQGAAARELLKVACDVDALYSIAAEDAAHGIRRSIAAIWSDHSDYQPEWAADTPDQ